MGAAMFRMMRERAAKAATEQGAATEQEGSTEQEGDDGASTAADQPAPVAADQPALEAAEPTQGACPVKAPAKAAAKSPR